MPLFDAILENKNYTEEVARRILRKLLSALRYLHRAGVAHRDVKPENIQVHMNGPIGGAQDEQQQHHTEDEQQQHTPGQLQVKLLDFGLSKRVGTGLLTPVGTLGYKAPELVLEQRHNQAVDMWSVGVIAYIMLCGFPPFFSDEEARLDHDYVMNAPFWLFFNDDSQVLRQQILRGHPSFPSPAWDHISPHAQSFVSLLLVVDPTRRLSAEEASRHPWISVCLLLLTLLSTFLFSFLFFSVCVRGCKGVCWV
jgi:calcium/calmodulin-dependent protein kinase I